MSKIFDFIVESEIPGSLKIKKDISLLLDNNLKFSLLEFPQKNKEKLFETGKKNESLPGLSHALYFLSLVYQEKINLKDWEQQFLAFAGTELEDINDKDIYVPYIRLRHGWELTFGTLKFILNANFSLLVFFSQE